MVFIGYCHRGVKGPSPAEKGPRHPHWTSPPVIDVVAARRLDEGRLAWWRSIVSAVWYVAVCCHFLSGSSISALGSVRLCNLQPPPEREEWKAKKERERERMKLMMGNDHPSSIFPPFLVHGTTYFFFLLSSSLASIFHTLHQNGCYCAVPCPDRNNNYHWNRHIIRICM